MPSIRRCVVLAEASEAVRLYRTAAEKGTRKPCLHLGRMYADGHGVAKDETEAFALFRQAAEKVRSRHV